jgi:hypothetical protein
MEPHIASSDFDFQVLHDILGQLVSICYLDHGVGSGQLEGVNGTVLQDSSGGVGGTSKWPAPWASQLIVSRICFFHTFCFIKYGQIWMLPAA